MYKVAPRKSFVLGNMARKIPVGWLALFLLIIVTHARPVRGMHMSVHSPDRKCGKEEPWPWTWHNAKCEHIHVHVHDMVLHAYDANMYEIMNAKKKEKESAALKTSVGRVTQNEGLFRCGLKCGFSLERTQSTPNKNR